MKKWPVFAFDKKVVSKNCILLLNCHFLSQMMTDRNEICRSISLHNFLSAISYTLCADLALKRHCKSQKLGQKYFFASPGSPFWRQYGQSYIKYL